MNDNYFEILEDTFKSLKLSITAEEFAGLAAKENYDEKSLEAIYSFLQYVESQRKEAIITTCLRLSRLPLKEPKTFEKFNFDRLHGKDIEVLKNLPTLTALYEKRNLAFIGQPGIGKTHLAMAFGRKCCELGIKAYFIKANELDQRLTQARKTDRLGSVINGLVKPSCLIIDEIGRCTFSKENTRLFFDIVDRRGNKEGPNCMIFTSNCTPSTWTEFFEEGDSLLCALDRIFDNAQVFMMKGEGYRGRKLETYAVEAADTMNK